MRQKKQILVAPLNWGLGHATRCIPIINALLDYGFEPVIASDGDALELLKKEFSNLQHIELPAYGIEYPRNGKHLKLKLLKHLPKLLKIIKAEKRIVNNIIDTHHIEGIISDNRFGVYSKNTPSVYITHQLKVLSGNTTWLSSRMHQRVIKKFDECWIPDIEGNSNLSGKLGHLNNHFISTKYLGILSRFNSIKTDETYNLMILLSGPEPQRGILENHLLTQVQDYKGKVLFVKGKIEASQTKEIKNNVTIINYLTGNALDTAINKSEVIVSRSGYTTILDLAKLGKKAFFIPTPGQFEQEYLAQRFFDKKITLYCAQDEFTIDKLELLKDYSGFKTLEPSSIPKALFSLFECE